MWVKALRLLNIRSFIDQAIEFSKTVNVLVGPNNSGKSTILLPLLGLQEELPTLRPDDIRIKAGPVKVEVELADRIRAFFPGFSKLWYEKPGNEPRIVLMGNQGGKAKICPRIPARERKNFICPFLSYRRVATLQDDATPIAATTVYADLRNLHAKIDTAASSTIEHVQRFYMDACQRILGCRIAAVYAGKGRRAVYTIDQDTNIPLTAMSGGTMNILALIAQLATTSGKLFVIEELEDDIHPKALKQLLELITRKAEDNQFVVTTHSHIVLKALGALADAKVFWVDMKFDHAIPTSTVDELGKGVEERLEVLGKLGYEFGDYGLWKGWLILEESSAEKIIREYLIPWFVPSLCGRLRTYSAVSMSQAKQRFADYNGLFAFLHLEQVYKNRAWVILDAGDKEREIIEAMQDTYAGSGWRKEQFVQWSKHDFEEYYPPDFQERFLKIKEMPNPRDRREPKEKLLHDVEAWIAEDNNAAEKVFEESAADVIQVLSDIEKALGHVAL